MKSRQKNINEEIERIKSLFTEERLYGNLVEQEEEYTNQPITKDVEVVINTLKKNADEEGRVDIKDPNIIQKIRKSIKIASDEVKDRVLNTGLGMKDRKKDRQGFGHMSTKEKADAMSTQKTDQRNVKKKGKKDLAACNRGMKALQKYFLSNPNPKNRMTIETFKGGITGENFISRQSSVQECLDNFGGQMKTDKELISKRTVTEWITDIIIDEKNTHREISKEALKGTVGKGEQIKIKNLNGKNIGIITPTETKNQFKITGSKKRWFILKGTQTLDDLHKKYILKAMKMPNASITVVPNSPTREKDRDSFEITVG